MKDEIFSLCQSIFPDWKYLRSTDFIFDKPKGFSSFTMGIRCNKEVSPSAVLFRKLEGKNNAILEFESEKDVFLHLSNNGIAAKCHYYDSKCRIEAFYSGRTLLANDLFDPNNLRKIANQLYTFHQQQPAEIPRENFFELIRIKWRPIVEDILTNKLDCFPPVEREMCASLREIYQDSTMEKVFSLIPEGSLRFCHNDTYHGNIMKLENNEIKLLDFEFSCFNHPAYDFSNLFAETVMNHKEQNYPYFKINEPAYGEKELKILINAYLDNESFTYSKEREIKRDALLKCAMQMIPLSDYKYAMAAITLSTNPIQKLPFIPYAFQRFNKFKDACTDI